MTPEELKKRRIVNQYLTGQAEKLTVARDLCGVQAQFFTNALHALKIRSKDSKEAEVGEGLVKNWTVRGTVHVFPLEDLAVYLAFDHAELYRSEDWSIPSFWNQRADWALTPRRQGELSSVILAALEETPCTREELKAICRERGMTQAEEESMFHPWGGGMRELCERGFAHAPAQEEKTYALSPQVRMMERDEARLELARRYFTHFAPATIHDAMYFFRVSASEVKKWLKQLPVVETECDGKTYYSIPKAENAVGDIPRCLFLAGFDQLMLGYEKKESLFLAPEDMRSIFSLAGIVSPAVLLDGNVVGRWKKKGRSVQVELFSPLARSEQKAVRETVEQLWGADAAEHLTME